jgi:flagellar protein FliS
MTAASSYRQAAVRAASPIHLVVVLYEQLLKDLRLALSAIERGDIPARTHEVDHALAVVAQLQGTLDMEQGGDVARNLEEFYNLLRLSLLVTDPTAATHVFPKQISNVLLLRQAWAQLESGQTSAAPEGANVSKHFAREDASIGCESENWKA